MLTSVLTKSVLDRWRSMAVGSVAIGLLLFFGMTVYRDIDLAVYTDLPDVFKSLVGIPEDADVASLAYGAIYRSYGMLTMAGIALSIGATAIAGEEHKGTLGLLLGNPVSRTRVLVSKAASMTLLSITGVAVLWIFGAVAPVVLDVDVTGIHVGALTLHLLVVILFFSYLALAIGSWTGRSGIASGVSAGLMVVSFFAVGLFPLIEGWEDTAKLFPLYYFSGSDPILNGVHWGHLAILMGSTVAFAVLAVWGVNRRDLTSRSVGVGVIDRLRDHPLTGKIVERLAGSARVSRIWVKTVTDHQALTVIVALIMFYMAIIIGPMYSLISDALKSASDIFPERLLALFGGGDMGTPEGFYQIEIFGLMAPIATMTIAIAMGAKAIAGEQDDRTLGLLLANPVSRTSVLLQKLGAMTVNTVIAGIAIWAGTMGGSLLAGLGMSAGNVAATTALAVMVGLGFGALAATIGAGTGSPSVAVWAPVGAGIGLYVANALLPFSDTLEPWAAVSPFHYYLSADPLIEGLPIGHLAVLIGLFVMLGATAVAVFNRSDLKQGA